MLMSTNFEEHDSCTLRRMDIPLHLLVFVKSMYSMNEKVLYLHVFFGGTLQAVE